MNLPRLVTTLKIQLVFEPFNCLGVPVQQGCLVTHQNFGVTIHCIVGQPVPVRVGQCWTASYNDRDSSATAQNRFHGFVNPFIVLTHRIGRFS